MGALGSPCENAGFGRRTLWPLWARGPLGSWDGQRGAGGIPRVRRAPRNGGFPGGKPLGGLTRIFRPQKVSHPGPRRFLPHQSLIFPRGGHRGKRKRKSLTISPLFLFGERQGGPEERTHFWPAGPREKRTRGGARRHTQRQKKRNLSPQGGGGPPGGGPALRRPPKEESTGGSNIPQGPTKGGRRGEKRRASKPFPGGRGPLSPTRAAGLHTTNNFNRGVGPPRKRTTTFGGTHPPRGGGGEIPRPARHQGLYIVRVVKPTTNRGG